MTSKKKHSTSQSSIYALRYPHLMLCQFLMQHLSFAQAFLGICWLLQTMVFWCLPLGNQWSSLNRACVDPTDDLCTSPIFSVFPCSTSLFETKMNKLGINCSNISLDGFQKWLVCVDIQMVKIEDVRKITGIFIWWNPWSFIFCFCSASNGIVVITDIITLFCLAVKWEERMEEDGAAIYLGVAGKTGKNQKFKANYYDG